MARLSAEFKRTGATTLTIKVTNVSTAWEIIQAGIVGPYVHWFHGGLDYVGGPIQQRAEGALLLNPGDEFLVHCTFTEPFPTLVGSRIVFTLRLGSTITDSDFFKWEYKF